jgi:hypothetical protein
MNSRSASTRGQVSKPASNSRRAKSNNSSEDLAEEEDDQQEEEQDEDEEQEEEEAEVFLRRDLIRLRNDSYLLLRLLVFKLFVSNDIYGFFVILSHLLLHVDKWLLAIAELLSLRSSMTQRRTRMARMSRQRRAM